MGLIFRLILLNVIILSSTFFIYKNNVLIAGPSLKNKVGKIQKVDQIKRYYGYLYWENGSPQQRISRRPKSWVNPEMVNNPDIVFQTGFYNVRFETDTLKFSGFESSLGSDYLTALTEDVSFAVGLEALLLLAVKVLEGEKVIEYKATSAIVETETELNVRLIENGRFVQRIDHTGLIFINSEGEVLSENGFFEITSWPHQMVLSLDFSKTSLQLEEVSIKLLTPNGKKHYSVESGSKTSLKIEPQADIVLGNPTISIAEAYEKYTYKTLTRRFDKEYHAHKIDIPIGKNNDYHHVHEFVIEISNSDSKVQMVPIIFNQVDGFKSITGTVMSLVELDGRPSGIPVQISKNWHKRYSDKHAGNWLRGSTVIEVGANSRRKLILRVIGGYWDEAATASHSQLSLVGWGKYAWKWDESALGAWGESMTFDPGQTVAGAFIADIRPTFTTPMGSSTDHAWTENVGGGDFLKFFDRNGKYRWPKKLKTAYHWTGPNMTEVLYSGITDDDSIKFVYKTQLLRSNDYHRRFNHFKYKFLKDVRPKRIVFYQMAANYYMMPEFVNAYLGDGLSTKKLSPQHGENLYTTKFPFKNNWLAIDDLNSGKNTARSNRGIIWRKSKFNNTDYDFYMHVYGRTWGRDTSLFDISGELTDQKYSTGDMIEGEIEFIMPGKSSDFYWGVDNHFIKRLNESSKSWMLIEQEFLDNNFQVSLSGGTIIKHYPVEVRPKGEKLDVRIVIPEFKGIGHITIILRDVNPHKILYAHILMNGEWVPASNNYGHYGNHSYYQAYLNAKDQKDYVFNIIRPDSYPFDQSLTIRITEKKLFTTGCIIQN